MSDLNKELYANEILDDWKTRGGIIHAEKHLFETYLKDHTKSIIEAGTGGGRLALYIEEMGFKNIRAFDLVPEMIAHAKERANKAKSAITFDVCDATNLTKYKDNSFDYSIYLQQVLCFICDENAFLEALKESYRITNKNGLIMYSFLDMDARIYNKPLRSTLNILRFFRGEKRSKNLLPWMKINDKFNTKFLNKNQPLTYWVNKKKIIAQLEHIGFEILEAKNANELLNNGSSKKGMLYIVCKK